MDPYRKYAELNARLASGETLYAESRGSGLTIHPTDASDRKRLRYPRIGIYAGSGTSHSWLWFVDLFDRMGFYDIRCLDEQAVCAEGLEDLDVLAVSGGDTFAVAAALGAEGAEKINAFVQRGGVYIGSCAGAYLPMRSSKPPLDLFNFVDVKITNLSKLLPPAEQMPHKFCTAYGCQFIFHPVREAVRLQKTGIPPFAGHATLMAPLYGGPAMIARDPDHILARYAGFTSKTQFLVNRALADQTLIDKAAAVRVPAGEGSFYLFGPHFEHPRFAEANHLVADVVYWDLPDRPCRPPQAACEGDRVMPVARGKALARNIRGELSNARIVAAGLELMPIQWQIGAKVYDPQKIRVYIESMWSRVRALQNMPFCSCGDYEFECLMRYGAETTRLLRRLKQQVDSRQESLGLAEELISLLHRYATTFFDLYFGSVSRFRQLRAA